MEERLLNTDIGNPELLSPLTLAFIGDGVFDLMVREKLVVQANRPVKKLNEEKVKHVRATAQAEFFLKIEGVLSEEELNIFKRGRNAKANTPKNVSTADYHTATGVEALFGYLYLSGKMARLCEIFRLL